MWRKISHHLMSIKRKKENESDRKYEMPRKNLYFNKRPLYGTLVYTQFSFFVCVFFSHHFSLIISIHNVIFHLSMFRHILSAKYQLTMPLALHINVTSFFFCFHVEDAVSVCANTWRQPVLFRRKCFCCEKLRCDKFILLLIMLPMYERIGDLFLFFIHSFRLMLPHALGTIYNAFMQTIGRADKYILIYIYASGTRLRVWRKARGKAKE